MKKIYLFVVVVFAWAMCATLQAQTPRLTNIKSEDGESYLNMEYDSQGRVTKIEIEKEWAGERFEISYDPIVIQAYETYGEDNWQHTYSYTVTTDNQGRVTKVVATGISYGNGKPSDFVETYTYNSEGYLIQSDRVWEGGKDYDTNRYTWTGGNLTNISWTQVWLAQWYDGENWHEANGTSYGRAVTTYGNQLCTDRPITIGLWFTYAGCTLESISGLFGKPCHNLPSQVTLSGRDDYPEGYPYEDRWNEDESEELVTFNYTLNADGSVASEFYWDEYDGEEDEALLVYTYAGVVDGLGKLHKDYSLRIRQNGKVICVTLDDEYDELQILNAAGQTLKRIPVGEGQRQVNFSTRGLGSGVNVVRANGRNRQTSRKFIVK